MTQMFYCISLLGKAFKMKKSDTYFFVIAFSVAGLFKIYANGGFVIQQCTKFQFHTEKIFRDIPFFGILHQFVSTL